MIGVGLLEAAATAWIAIYASLLSDPQSLYDNKMVIDAFRIIGLETVPSTEILLIAGSALMAFLIAAKNALRGLSRYLTGHYSASVSALFGKRLMHRYLYRPYSWYLTQKGSELQQTVEWRIFVSEFLLNILQALSDLIIVVFLFVTLIIYNITIAGPIVLGIGFFATIIYITIRRRLRSIAERLKVFIEKSFHEMRSTILAYKDVRIFGNEEYSYARYRKPMDKAIRYQASQAFWVGAPMLFLESLGFIALAVLILIMIYFQGATSEEALSLMALMAVTAWRILPALNRLLSSQSRIQVGLPYIDSVLTMVGTDESAGDDKNRGVRMEQFESLEFKNVSFCYPNSDSPALEGLNLKISKGEKVGIIGVSGGGKTTLVDVLTGLLKPSSGTLSINGQELSIYSPQSWSDIISYIPQKVHLITGGLGENVAFGVDKEEIDLDRVRDACIRASLGEFLDSYETDGELFREIEDDGKNLSGGQVQRIGVARMFYRDTDFWIVDEGTASLDRDNEKNILNEMFNDEQRTIMFITHRLETLKHCERIVIIDAGCIVRDGSREELLPAILDSDLIREEDDDDGN
jgi:ABC-type multidrug transport system fused ATPase/permease subunit